MSSRFFLALVFGFVVAAAEGPAKAACADSGGIGGTGMTADGGIGGTGVRADGGIGGTGARAEADLHLFGVITGFGSICVNGIEVHYNPSTPILINAQPASSAALSVGQTVLVRAADAGNGAAQARSIQIAEAAVGAVTAIDASAGIFHVAGQPVRLDPATLFGPGLGPDLARAAKIGDTLRVSGLRTANGTIAATRVDRATLAVPAAMAPSVGDLAGGRFVVQGYVTAPLDSGAIRVGAIAFQIELQIGRQLSVDRLVRLSGRSEPDGRLVAERAELLSSMLNPRPERVVGAATGDGGRSRDRSEGSGNRDRRPEQLDRGGSDRPERPERMDRGGSDRPERPERVDRSGRH